ncbi:4'-phosphopantetheinyl transferase superfamily protein [Rhodoferax sp.]|uniref:4'-phosphopantetheinyl transferase family protein n=1 Tax=Rhodoferax sp. TaxID=50421 RepID=UPI003A1026D8
MAQAVCHPVEQRHLEVQTLEQAARDFLVFWTQKEAWLKCQGYGLDFGRMASVALRDSGAAEANTWSWQTQSLTLSLHGLLAGNVRCAGWLGGCHAPPPVRVGRMVELS